VPVPAVAVETVPAEPAAVEPAPPAMRPAHPRAATAVETPVAVEAGASPAGEREGSADLALPEQPDRAGVRAALDALQPTMRACAAGNAGVVMVTVTLAASGRVTTAQVTGPVVGAQGSCIARAARQARVPPFRAPFVTVSYPIQL